MKENLDGIYFIQPQFTGLSWCNFNSSNIQTVEKWKAIQYVERIPY